MKIIDLSGLWECSLPGQEGPLRLPGTLEEGGFGFPDDPGRQWNAEEIRRRGIWHEGDPILTRLTRKRVFEGQARFRRFLCWDVPAGCRVFLECERTRHLRLIVNGQEAQAAEPACLSAPCVFEVTGLVTGRDDFVLLSDNSYPDWPREAIVCASAASDETQTNWNGMLGYLRLRVEKPDFIAGIRVCPSGNLADIRVELNLSRDREGMLRFSSPALCAGQEDFFSEKAGQREIRYKALLSPEIRRWDLEEGNLYSLTVSAEGFDSRTVSFGVRDFAALNGHLTLNGRRVFLRGETNCAVFPETGYIPTDADTWRSILEKYRSYGVNCVRFHSHCPPEAAFVAADEAGMLMQPELSHWDPVHAFASAESRRYYASEAKQILRHLANHPSFVMLSFGNELHYDEEAGIFVSGLLRELREEDPTRLYANGSNPFYGAKGPDPAADFYTSSEDRGRMLRATSADFQGWLNREAANACRDYSAEMAEFRRSSGLPVFSFEIGQYEVLPDFWEIREYHGVTVPENLLLMQRRMISAGLETLWTRMVNAAGENALQCYRAEVEAALRTEAFSGISLLSLQDFPGQGVALVGMMNAHLEPKPYDFAKPERFAAFFRDVLPLPLLPRYVYTAGEEMSFPVRIANYGKTDLRGPVAWTLSGNGWTLSGEEKPLRVPAGSLSEAVPVSVRLPGLKVPEKLVLILRFCGSGNETPLWVYPKVRPSCPPDVLECRVLDAGAWNVLASGGKVYLAPDSTEEALPRSVQAQFSPDFWSVCTFPSQSGCMGQLIDTDHPLFRAFPTESFSSWQWHPMACRRAILLPCRMKAIIAEMDSCVLLRPMAQLFECRCGGGKLMVSSLGLHQLEPSPNVLALQKAVYDYMASDLFCPDQDLSPETAASFLPCAPLMPSSPLSPVPGSSVPSASGTSIPARMP